MTFALIPAAGKSLRMGRPKLALPAGGKTVLERVVETLRQAGVQPILVVVGPHVPELVPLAAAAGADVHLLSQETEDMRATVEQGLAWLGERFKPSPDDQWFLVPADHPTLDPDVIRVLEEARAARPQFTIVIPTFQGRRGHPTLIAWKHVAGIRRLAPGLGLNAYLRHYRAETLEVPGESADILCDLDTPEDYERLVRRWAPPTA
jgi:molybdenum cofactor cytidylyltransferase